MARIAPDFQTAVDLVLAHEGGRVDNPKDPGGRTNMGVTQAVYTAWRKKKGLPLRDVWAMSRNEAVEIYKTQYFDAVRFDDLPPGLGYAVADFAVHSGAVRAVKELQLLLGVTADGQVGNLTLAAVWGFEKQNELADMILAYCGRRMDYLKTLKTWATFQTGWTRRVCGLRAGAQADDRGVVDYAMSMARDPAAQFDRPAAVGRRPGETAGGKAPPSDKKTALTPESVGSATAGAGVLAGVLDQAVERLMPFADDALFGGVLQIAIPLLTAVGTGLLIYSAVRALRAQKIA